MATVNLPPDFKEFLQLLSAHQVEDLLIGGYAVAYHGYPRATADMDIWIALHPQNAERWSLPSKRLASISPNSRQHSSSRKGRSSAWAYHPSGLRLPPAFLGCALKSVMRYGRLIF